MKEKAAAIVLAFIGMCGIGMELAISGTGRQVWGDLLLLPCVYFLYRLYLACFLKKASKGFYSLTGGMSVLFSVMLTAGAILDQGLAFTWKKILAGAALTAAFYPLLATFTGWLDDSAKGFESNKMNENKKRCCICFFIVAFFWVLTYLALFPGVYGTDAPYWYYEFSAKDVPISSQWSPFYCAIFYGLVKFGEGIFGSYNAGFGVFSFVQMSFVLFVVYRILSFLDKRFSLTAVIMAAAFFAWIPTHVILSLTSAQDSVFAACFAMCMIHLSEMACDPNGYFAVRKNWVQMLLWLILLCMIRNNGFYAVLVMGVFVIGFMRRGRIRMLAMVLLTMATVSICQGPVYNWLGIQKGTALREMLSLPLQQMAYAYNYGYERLTEEEKKKMLQYISDEGWRSYEACISDHVKGSLDTEAVQNHMFEFWKLYAKIFFTVPDCYVAGAGMQTVGLWYPNKIYPDARTWHPYINYLCVTRNDFTDFSVIRNSQLPMYEKILGMLYGRGEYDTGYGGMLSMEFSHLPVVGILSKPGIYCWLLLYTFFYAVYRKWKEKFVVIGLEVGVFLTILLSPVIIYRYCSPMIFSAPVFFSLLLWPHS